MRAVKEVVSIGLTTTPVVYLMALNTYPNAETASMASLATADIALTMAKKPKPTPMKRPSRDPMPDPGPENTKEKK